MTVVLRLHAPIALPCDPTCQVIRDAVVDIDSTGRIVYCGPAQQAALRAPETVVHRLTGAVLPGFINTHAHTPMTLLRGMGGDLPLLRWLHEVIWPSEATLTGSDIHAGMMLGCIEMLRAGITTSVEMFFFAEHMVSAVLETGSRVVLTPAIADIPQWRRTGTWQEMLIALNRWIDSDGLYFGPGQRIELGYGPHSAYTLPSTALTEIAEAAQARKALLHIHVAETIGTEEVQRTQYGSVPIMLERLGVLDGRVLAAHAVHLSDHDIALFAQKNVGIAHCPGSNAKLASGIARLTDLLAANIHIGLGTDGPASNDDLDLWPEMQLAGQLARLSTMDAAVLPAEEILLLATYGGAAAVGRTDIGNLAPGSWADIIHIDLDGPAFPLGADAPDRQLLANLVWASGSRQVRDVWVAGEQVLCDSEPTKVDRQEAQHAVRAIASRLAR